MKIILNGQEKPLNPKTSITDLLIQNGYDGKLVAVAINETFLPKTKYSETYINDQDKIEIVAPMQGG